MARAYRTDRSSGQVQKRCTGTPGIVKRGVQNLQKFRYRHDGRTELTEVPGTGIHVPGILELTEVLCRVFHG